MGNINSHPKPRHAETQLLHATNQSNLKEVIYTANDKELPITNEQILDTISAKKRGAKSASIEATTNATSEDIKEITSNILHWYGKKIVKDDDECAERLNEYFERINQTGEIPTVEKMCLALGTVRQVVWQWENGMGCSQARADMIKKAKEILAAMDAELVSRGKIPQVTYIFRAKNFFGLRDQTDLVITPNNPLGEVQDPDTIAEKYKYLPTE